MNLLELDELLGFGLCVMKLSNFVVRKDIQYGTRNEDEDQAKNWVGRLGSDPL